MSGAGNLAGGHPPGARGSGRPSSGSGDPTSSIYTALGGRRGLLDMGLPGVIFAAVFPFAGLAPAAWGAVAVAGVLVVVRVVRRETLQHVISGFMAVAVGWFIASRTGQAQDFFLPKLFINAGYALGYALSILVRWPIMGVVLGPLLGEGFDWRRSPARQRAYARATWLWVAMFVARLCIEVPLYLAGQVVALSVAHVALGWPLWLLVAWLTWLVMRGTRPVTAEKSPDREPESAPGAGETP